MRVTRRTFVQTSTIAAGAALLGTRTVGAQRRGGDNSGGDSIPPSIRALKPLPHPPPPLTDDEPRRRPAQGQRLMGGHGGGAVVLEGGPSLCVLPHLRQGPGGAP